MADTKKNFADDFIAAPGKSFSLASCDPRDASGLGDKDKAKAQTADDAIAIDALQNKLFAEGKRALLVVLQGIDTAGKDGTIRHVMSGLNPQGCMVASFKAPVPVEQGHDFLWRVHASCPPHGYIGIFNRSRPSLARRSCTSRRW